jgi:hypothetical protein
MALNIPPQFYNGIGTFFWNNSFPVAKRIFRTFVGGSIISTTLQSQFQRVQLSKSTNSHIVQNRGGLAIDDVEQQKRKRESLRGHAATRMNSKPPE